MEKTKKKHPVLWILLILVLLILSYAALLGVKGYKLYQQAQPLISDIKLIKSNGLNVDKEAFSTFSEDYKSFSGDAKELLEKPYVSVLRKLSFIKQYFEAVDTAFVLGDKAVSDVVEPLPELLENYSVKGIKVDGGYDVKSLSAYLDFACNNLGLVKDVLIFANGLDLPLLERFVDLSEIKQITGKALLEYDYIENLVRFAQAFLGNGENKEYFLAVQNSAEIRASGGFVGSMAPVYIRDGILSFGQFDSWFPYMTYSVNGITEVSAEEYKLFSYMVNYPRDYGYNPDFVRLAEVWSDCFRYVQGVPLDGVISLTPAILQELFKVADASVSLFNGTVIDGSNATKFLQYDIYYKYQAAGMDVFANNEIADALFAEAANKGMDAIVNDLDIDKILGYIDVFKQSAEDRVLMIWMRDEEEQNIVKNLGCSGAMNYDKDAPEVGIFFSCYDPGRLGLFVDIDASIVGSQKNSDGSVSYDIEVKYNNTMTDQEYYTGGTRYICGHYGGDCICFVHYFAPMGGTISNFSLPDGYSLNFDRYKDLDLAYSLDWVIRRNRPITVSFTVTTAPGVDAPLKIKTTPSVYDYVHAE